MSRLLELVGVVYGAESFLSDLFALLDGIRSSTE